MYLKGSSRFEICPLLPVYVRYFRSQRTKLANFPLFPLLEELSEYYWRLPYLDLLPTQIGVSMSLLV